MKSHCKLLGILAVIAYSFVGAGSASAQLQWAVVNSVPTSNTLRYVIYGDSQYVAVGDTGTILTSPDGLNWTSRTSGTTSNLNSVTYGNYGNGLFVVVGNGGRILSSPDGATWTNRGSGTTVDLNSVAYGNGHYVAVENCSPDSVLISTDGVVWSSHAINYSILKYIAYGNGQYWAQYGTSIVISSGGIVWVIYTTFNVGTLGSMDFATYSNGKIIALGSTSPGAHPVIGTLEGTMFFYSLIGSDVSCGTYYNGLYVVMGHTNMPGSGPSCYTSTDGTTWTVQTTNTISTTLNFITYGDSRYVAVGSNGTIIISSAISAIKPVKSQTLLASSLTVQARNSLLTISLPSAMLGKAVDLAVYSVSGQEIMRKRVNSSAERFTVPVNFSYGSYILVANDGSRKTSIKFVAVR